MSNYNNNNKNINKYRTTATQHYNEQFLVNILYGYDVLYNFLKLLRYH